jgi:DNA polymerase
LGVNELFPVKEWLARVRGEAAGCMRCPLYRLGTQTAFGEGPVSGAVMLVGDEKGEQEDLQ